MGDIIAERLSRRDLAKGVLAVTAMTAIVSPYVTAKEAQAAPFAANTTPSFGFQEAVPGRYATHHVANGYDADILIRWGDKVLWDAPEFDPYHQTPRSQAKQFGYNNDFIGYIPFEKRIFGFSFPSSEHGLLVVNHEYTDEELMFPNLGPQDGDKNFADMTIALTAIEMMAHGGSVLEIKKRSGKWEVVPGSHYARRITAGTLMHISGPASGHAKMKTPADPSGTKVLGMLNNCAGGITPWGTWLTCEENFNGYFLNKAAAEASPDAAALKRYGVPGESYGWAKFYDRYDVAKAPNEANRFGWVVEIDPLDPTSLPIKRTALGRLKHEGAENIINRDGRLVIYLGDDERFDYVYKFVTEGRVDRYNRAANRNLLDKGILYVARFDANGTGTWMPLVHGQNGLTAANGFKDQGDVLIHARLAGDVLGATKMDRPEDITVNPRTGKVYVALTNNSRRTAAQVDAANPRAPNLYGHILEIIPDARDHAGTTFRWEILVKCGNPANPAIAASFHPATTKNGWFGMPDNFATDPSGRLWVATDGNHPTVTGRTDGLYAIETEGPSRATSKLFYRVPLGAELCGPAFTPDSTTLFVAVQHPGEGDADTPSTFQTPLTRWPDFKDGMPPRPAVVAITKKAGGKIGS